MNKHLLLIKYANMTNEALAEEWQKLRLKKESWEKHLKSATGVETQNYIDTAKEKINETIEMMLVLEEAMMEK